MKQHVMGTVNYCIVLYMPVILYFKYHFSWTACFNGCVCVVFLAILWNDRQVSAPCKPVNVTYTDTFINVFFFLFIFMWNVCKWLWISLFFFCSPVTGVWCVGLPVFGNDQMECVNASKLNPLWLCRREMSSHFRHNRTPLNVHEHYI